MGTERTTPQTDRHESELLDGKRIHPYAALFPPMSDEEFAAIAEDVKAHGLVEPIILLDGQILDGIHRLKACIQTGVQPRYQDWNGEGGTPIQYVWSRNWTRRHLTASQRAVVALNVEKEFARETVRGRPRREKDGTIATISGTARDKAAEVVGVSGRYLQDAKLLENSSPALLEQVRLGHLTLPAAKRQAVKSSQKPAKDSPTHRVRIEFSGHALHSDRLPKAEAAQLLDGLTKRLSADKDFAVRLIGKTEKIGSSAKAAYGTGEWASVNVNIARGCQHDCLYCFSKGYAVRFKQVTAETWKTPQVKSDTVTKNWRKRSGTIMFPSSHDLHPDNIEDCLTVLRSMLAAGNRVLIVSKPHLPCIKRLCDELVDFKAQILFRFTICSANDAVLKAWEPGAPAFSERLASLKHAFRSGYQTSVSCEPMLDANIHAVIRAAMPFVTDTVWLGKANNLANIVSLNRPQDAVAKQMAADLNALMSNQFIGDLYARYKDDPKIRWKDSIKKTMGLARPTQKGLDV